MTTAEIDVGTLRRAAQEAAQEAAAPVIHTAAGTDDAQVAYAEWRRLEQAASEAYVAASLAAASSGMGARTLAAHLRTTRGVTGEMLCEGRRVLRGEHRRRSNRNRGRQSRG